MKQFKYGSRIASMFVVMALVAGCPGTNVAGGVSLAQARATCLKLDDSQEAVDAFEAVVLAAEISRNEGAPASFFISSFSPVCENPENTDAEVANCFLCITQLAAAVWK